MIFEENELEDFAPWFVITITLIGGLLRVILLATKGMWLDETFSVWLANQTMSDMLQWIVKIDQHPPLYYLQLHYWIALNGDTPYSVRLLSVIFGASNGRSGGQLRAGFGAMDNVADAELPRGRETALIVIDIQ